MKTRVFAVLFVLTGIVNSPGADLATLSGQIYKDASVTSHDAIGLNVAHAGGISRIPFTELSPEIQNQYGYDPQKAQVQAVQERAAAVERAKINADVQRKIAEARAQREKEAQEQKETDAWMKKREQEVEQWAANPPQLPPRRANPGFVRLTEKDELSDEIIQAAISAISENNGGKGFRLGHQGRSTIEIVGAETRGHISKQGVSYELFLNGKTAPVYKQGNSVVVGELK